MKYVLLISFLSCLFHSGAQDFFHAQVLVRNFNEISIPHSEVQLTDTVGALIYRGVTDHDGQFELTMKPGKYRVKLFIDGELKKDKSINLPILEGQKIYNH